MGGYDDLYIQSLGEWAWASEYPTGTGTGAAAGIILFWQPAVLIGIWGYFIQKPLRAAVLLAALIVAWCFVFGPEWFKKENKKEELPREHP